MLGGSLYEVTGYCPLCGNLMWNGKCENPDCPYFWHPKDEEDN